MGYKVFPPYVDAYYSNVAAQEVEKRMIDHALQWGAEAVGKAILEGNEVPTDEEGRKVVCCAVSYEADEPSLLCVVDPDSDEEFWFNKLIVVREYVPYGWNVT